MTIKPYVAFWYKRPETSLSFPGTDTDGPWTAIEESKYMLLQSFAPSSLTLLVRRDEMRAFQSCAKSSYGNKSIDDFSVYEDTMT